ncbi:MAG: hypothetical protein FJ108_16445 [Deltaproteobacteria bacterium]|nr:hypothetical protein [Deltaproteobacteria bacterium]
MRAISLLLAMVSGLATANVAMADWWSENFELHGKANSSVYFNSPSLSKDFQMDQWMNSVEMNFDVRLFSDSDLDVSFHGIVTPTYDAVYDLYPQYFGDRRSPAGPGTAVQANAANAMDGEKFPGHGSCIRGNYCDTAADTANFFGGNNNPQFVYDNTIFFGILGAASRTRGSEQGHLGGNSNAKAWNIAEQRILATGATPATNNFLGSLELADIYLAGAGLTQGAPIHSFGGRYIVGDRGTIDRQAPFGLNHTDGELSTRCWDGVHDWCWAREAYFEVKYKDTQVRLGRQQVVWGKTDAFRLQDLVNPIDYSTHNVYPSLEERRIPSLSIDLIHSFGTVGPLQDFSLELVWVVDRFKPLQVGQCGDFWAFTAACEGRADAGAHGLLNQSLARVEERGWSLSNTEPGFRFEFRIPEPSIAFSLSGFWGIQDAPVARFKNHYSTTNPNPAMMLFLQALGFPAAVIPAFNPYDQASVQAASDNALAVWTFGIGPICGTNPICYNAPGIDIQPLGWIWSASQAQLEYPRTFTLGGSLDYQIPGIDTVLRLETAYDFDRKINNTNELDGIDSSDVLLAAIGLDRSFFIPLLNKDRTAFVSFQTFIEHVMDYEGDSRSGMVQHENNIISTFFIENYWRNDSIVLTNFLAYDWSAQAWITGPKLKWVMNDQISFEVGVNLLQGSKNEHNIRNICPSGGYDCLADPTTWNDGNWQLINYQFKKYSMAPFFSKASFADNMMEKRDEVWAGVTYQF